MTDLVQEIEKKRHSFVLRMESGEAFWLTYTQMTEYGEVKPGQEIDSDQLRAWLLPRQYPMALNDAVALLAQRARAGGEIRQKLKRRLYMDDTIDMVLYKLEKERLLDDAAFAREWAASRARSQVGRSRILRELRMKGVAQDTAELALEELDEAEGDEAAAALARKLLRRYAGEADPRKAMSKLLAAMARRGYSYEDSRRAVQTAMEENE